MSGKALLRLYIFLTVEIYFVSFTVGVHVHSKDSHSRLLCQKFLTNKQVKTMSNTIAVSPSVVILEENILTPSSEVTFETSSVLDEAMALRQIEGFKLTGGNPHEIIDLLTQLSLHYVKERKFDKALLSLKDACKLAEITYGQEHSVVAEIMVEMAFINFSQRRFESARTYLEPAIAIYEKNFGLISEQVAFAFHKLAKVYQASGQMQMAEKYCQKALNIYEKTACRDDDQINAARNDLIKIRQAQ